MQKHWHPKEELGYNCSVDMITKKSNKRDSDITKYKCKEFIFISKRLTTYPVVNFFLWLLTAFGSGSTFPWPTRSEQIWSELLRSTQIHSDLIRIHSELLRTEQVLIRWLSKLLHQQELNQRPLDISHRKYDFTTEPN